MATHQHTFEIHSPEATLITFDPEAQAVYAKFSKNKVARSVQVEGTGGAVNFDLDRNGRVIGIEFLFVADFSLKEMHRQVERHLDRDLDFNQASIRFPAKEAAFAN